MRFDLAWLRRLAVRALALCIREPAGEGRAVLHEIDTLEVAIVSDKAIAAVHEQFMHIAGATDVITFDHGEIVISADTAQQNTAQFGKSVEEELALYTVHGLLHLNGFEDNTPPAAARMRAVQRRILKACLSETPPP